MALLYFTTAFAVTRNFVGPWGGALVALLILAAGIVVLWDRQQFTERRQAQPVVRRAQRHETAPPSASPPEPGQPSRRRWWHTSTYQTVLPAEMTGDAVRTVEFREKQRGYHPADVDDLLNRVADELDAGAPRPLS